MKAVVEFDKLDCGIFVHLEAVEIVLTEAVPTDPEQVIEIYTDKEGLQELANAINSTLEALSDRS